MVRKEHYEVLEFSGEDGRCISTRRYEKDEKAKALKEYSRLEMEGALVQLRLYSTFDGFEKEGIIFSTFGTCGDGCELI